MCSASVQAPALAEKIEIRSAKQHHEVSVDLGGSKDRVVLHNSADSGNPLSPQHHAGIGNSRPRRRSVNVHHRHVGFAPLYHFGHPQPFARIFAQCHANRIRALRTRGKHAVRLQILLQQFSNCWNLARLNCREIANGQLRLAWPKNVG